MEPIFGGLPPEPPKPLPMEQTYVTPIPTSFPEQGPPTQQAQVSPVQQTQVFPTQQNQFTLNPENFAQLGTRVDSIEDRLGKLGTTLDNQFSPRSQRGIGGYGGFGSPYGFNPYASMGGGFSSPFSSPLYGGIGQESDLRSGTRGSERRAHRTHAHCARGL